MNFLSPLFALAALAVVSPIIFHLVRRRPKEHIEFSSLLFLDPAPPKLTRSSQIDQWLLLLMILMRTMLKVMLVILTVGDADHNDDDEAD